MKSAAYACLALLAAPLAAAQNGYIGYQLNKRGDNESVNYETANTPGVELPETPDVYLNANVSVGEISIEVENITAKINLDAKVLSLLHFTAGVDVSIDSVSLLIQNVSAKVELEARLGNVVQMVSDVLDTIDLNPIVATLGNTLGNVVGNVTDVLNPDQGDAAGTVSKREVPADYNLKNNILYSVNDYSGATHKNRILDQDGNIFDMTLDNNGNERSREIVGSYLTDMVATGHSRTITIDGVTEFEVGYLYAPYPGLRVHALIFTTLSGEVVKTKCVAEAEAGGTSTISEDNDDRADLKL
ncbi:uncharacterized protein B0I36DRAFT_357218 [Microdochium trichocladiopsis]|uniref:Uncharacterized protein n=1 Tax=Microdochium trichocladiopsis TaxID=1682393 RepID=A0A9P8YH01_9PEZI|nr:uncharacterized protein B0I36DRAFT_357218 [Microdochium trichocladiopsis]KAH7039832.1 hypothetical protein B0I36DRAFT_357218 [Microdochium trichocladiopsis]